MSLYDRKAAEKEIQLSKAGQYPSPDFYESHILEASLEMDFSDSATIARACGRFRVIAIDLLEMTRRHDPSYGLTPISPEEEIFYHG